MFLFVATFVYTKIFLAIKVESLHGMFMIWTLRAELSSDKQETGKLEAVF